MLTKYVLGTRLDTLLFCTVLLNRHERNKCVGSFGSEFSLQEGPDHLNQQHYRRN